MDLHRYNLTAAIYLILSFMVFAQNNEKIEIGNLYPGEMEKSAFEISEKSTVYIKGKAGNFGEKFSYNVVFYGWIINSQSREVVWDARDDFEFDDENGIYDFDEVESLEAGKYEVYYVSNNGHNVEINNFSQLMSRIFSGLNKSKFKQKYRAELGITVFGEESKFHIIDPIKTVDELVSNSIASIIRVPDDMDLEKGFSLSDDTEVRIYSIGEGTKGTIIDLGWISDVKTNKIIWKPSLKKTSYAGGGRKNYLVDQNINLPKGSYMLHYSSDDSHSFEEWNVMPPNDPQFWGITIWAGSEKDKENVIPFRKEDVVTPMIEMTKVGDEEYRSQGFKLFKDSDLRILCLGEGYDKNDLVDYGWIVNADTKEIVWSMKNNEKIENAGGAEKNRMIEETISLEKGNYIAYYSSDDSHSYEDWNENTPFDKSRWGITIWSDTKNYDLFDANSYRSQNIISEIIKVEDNENLKKSFIISQDNKVRIIAIGEGTRSGMDDYGWIEDSEGDIVWEMTFRKTENAGGASKNRIFDGTINLDAGRYTLHYITDGSHSYNSWNSSPPENQDNYGITLMIEK